MTILPLIGVAFVSAIASILVKSVKPEISFAISLAGGIILLLFAIELAQNTLGFFQEIAQKTGISSALIKSLIKMLGISYLVEFAAGTLHEFGQTSLADKIIFCGKMLILLLAIPIIEEALSMIISLLELIK